MVVQNQSQIGEGLANPIDPHHTPTIIQPSTQPQKTQKPRKPRKDTQVPQPSDLTKIVADEAVHKELGDSLVRAATTASSLEAKQDIGGGPRCQETMRDTVAQTRFESVSKHSNDSLLARGNTLRSDEDRLKLDELMALCSTLQNRVLDLEKTKSTQHNEIGSLKRRVKKLEKKNRSRTHKLKRLYKIGLTARVESSDNEESLEQEVVANKESDEVNVVEEVVQVSDAGNVISTAGGATTVSAVTTTTGDDKGKGIMIEEPVKPMKKKDLICLDEEVALKIQAEYDEE
ncbi:hypothetical protein Tco_1251596 [Tanacetum coccineum]